MAKNPSKDQSFTVPLSTLVPTAYPLSMQLVKAGKFMMGCPENHKHYLGSVNHEVEVVLTQHFWVSRYPITNAQWTAVMPAEFQKQDSTINTPVTNVNWNDASAFCEKLNDLCREYTDSGYAFRLPTEAEWEYTYKTGGGLRSDAPDFERALGEIAWYAGNTNQLMDVGLKNPNSWGIYDMQGNITEWCYDSAGYDRPLGLIYDYVSYDSLVARHVRSGSYKSPWSGFFFSDSAGDCWKVNAKHPWLGFRIVLGKRLD